MSDEPKAKGDPVIARNLADGTDPANATLASKTRAAGKSMGNRSETVTPSPVKFSNDRLGWMIILVLIAIIGFGWLGSSYSKKQIGLLEEMLAFLRGGGVVQTQSAPTGTVASTQPTASVADSHNITVPVDFNLKLQPHIDSSALDAIKVPVPVPTSSATVPTPVVVNNFFYGPPPAPASTTSAPASVDVKYPKLSPSIKPAKKPAKVIAPDTVVEPAPLPPSPSATKPMASPMRSAPPRRQLIAEIRDGEDVVRAQNGR